MRTCAHRGSHLHTHTHTPFRLPPYQLPLHRPQYSPLLFFSILHVFTQFSFNYFTLDSICTTPSISSVQDTNKQKQTGTHTGGGFPHNFSELPRLSPAVTAITQLRPPKKGKTPKRHTHTHGPRVSGVYLTRTRRAPVCTHTHTSRKVALHRIWSPYRYRQAPSFAGFGCTDTVQS